MATSNNSAKSENVAGNRNIANSSGIIRPTASNANSFLSQRCSDSDMSSSEPEDSCKIREADRFSVLQQENVVLKMEVETLKLRIKNLLEENKKLRQDSVNIQVRAEQEEEFISNTLLKKIQCLKKEKETLATNYEQEEEYLTNDLTRQLAQLRKEKVQLEQSLEAEQENQVAKLSRRIRKLERDISVKQDNLERLQREKIDLENALEQEQEFIVNKLWKKIKKIEQEKKSLTGNLRESTGEEKVSVENANREELINSLAQRCKELKSEVAILKLKLAEAESRSVEQNATFALEEEKIAKEKGRLQRKLLYEQERRTALSRVLSESESSLDTDEDRSISLHRSSITEGDKRERTISSPLPCVDPAIAPQTRYSSGSSSPISSTSGPSLSSSGIVTKHSINSLFSTSETVAEEQL